MKQDYICAGPLTEDALTGAVSDFLYRVRPHRERLWDYYEGLYKMVAVSDYDPADPANDYTVSTPNEYYRKLMSENQQDGRWLMGEDR